KSRTQFRRVVEIVEKRTPGAALTTVHQKLLGCALLLEDFDQAIAEATFLLQTQERAEYYYDRALARQRKGDLNGARGGCGAAQQEGGEVGAARPLRGSIARARGGAAPAVEEPAAASGARASDPKPPLAKGCALMLLGRDADALGDFKASLKANQGL